jgi:ABC-type glutathione transport system ATPase component
METSQAVERALGPALVEAKALSKRYQQRSPLSRKRFVVEALREVDFQIRPHCVTALVGQSGSGKSTLAACLSLLAQPDSGEIWFEGKPIAHCPKNELAQLRPRIQMVFQDSAGALNLRLTAAQIIEEPLEIHKRGSRQERRQRATKLMEEVGLRASWSERSPLQLSGGQRQRLAIARALACEPSLLILDESLSGLDLITQAHILNLVASLQATHSLTCLLISHDLGLVAQVADYVAVMHRGQVVDQGTKEQTLAHPRHEHTLQIVAAAQAVESGFARFQDALA